METVSIINENEVKKELFKSKVNAKFSHYVSGNIYYTVEMYGGIYQFPISTIENTSLRELAKNGLYDVEDGYNEFNGELKNKLVTLKEKNKIEGEESFTEIELINLSSDLGTTTFNNEIKGSELNRWIIKSIKNNEFIKIS